MFFPSIARNILKTLLASPKNPVQTSGRTPSRKRPPGRHKKLKQKNPGDQFARRYSRR